MGSEPRPLVGTGPLVSIVIPCFNREGLVGDALRSCLAQSYVNWECLVVDDGSTDGSLEVVSGFAEEDGRIRLLERNRAPKGAATCRNLGLEEARGSYVIFLDSDDLLAPFCLEERLRTMEGRNLDFMVFPMLYFRHRPLDTGELVAREGSGDDLSRFLRYDFPWHTTGPIWRRQELLRVIGGFDETAAGGGQDWEMHVRALASGMEYAVMNDALPDSFFRAHGGERMSRTESREVVEARKRLYEKVLGFLFERVDLEERARLGFAGVYLQMVSEPMLRFDRQLAMIWFRDFGRRLGLKGEWLARVDGFLSIPWERAPLPIIKRIVRRGWLGRMLPARARARHLSRRKMEEMRRRAGEG